MLVNNVWKYPKYATKQRTFLNNLRLYLAYNNTSKSAYWLDTHFVNVWWRYVLPSTNAIHFRDIFFRHRTIFSTCPNKESRKSKIHPCGGIFNKYPKPQHKLVCRLKACYKQRWQRQIDSPNNRRHTFIIFVWLVLIYGSFGSSIFFW